MKINPIKTAKIISLANNKGGVGKTSSCFNLSYALALEGNKILMVDNDPQSSLTIYTGIEPLELSKTMYDVMTNKCEASDAILKTDNDKIDILPSSIDLSVGELELMSRYGREMILKEKLESIKNNYDYVLIDNSPSLGTLTVNAMVASDYIIAPSEPSYLALRGMEILINTLDGIKKINKDLHFMGVLVSLFDVRIKHHQEVLDEFQKRYPVFKSIIKRSAQFSYSCIDCKSIMEFAGEKFEGSQAYMNLAKEVMNYGK
jgi:chromosome partitioning protein